MDEATRLRVTGHLAAAREKLAAAATLRREGHFADAISRAYYASYHAAMAPLVAHGLHARSHDGVRSLFGARFVQPGRIDRKHAKSLRLLHDERENGDYGTAIDWEEADASTAMVQAEELLAACVQILAEDTGEPW